jgi:hypothetical protein
MWSPQGCISVEVPYEATFLIQSIKWNRDGNSLALISKDQFCVCYLTKPNNQNKMKILNENNLFANGFNNNSDDDCDDLSERAQSN